MSSSASDAGIPLLTEIIPGADSDEPPELPLADILEDQDAAAIHQPADTAVLASRLDSEEWARLEREIRERIVQQLRGKIDRIIEQRIRENLSDMLQIAVDSIALELRSGLHQDLADTVSDVVAAELASARK